MPAISRILLKISGEALMGSQTHGLDPQMLDYVRAEVKKVVDAGIETAIVVGGGNLFRGISSSAAGLPRHVGDSLGMFATLMNATALAGYFNAHGLPAKAFSAFPVGNLLEPFSVDAARAALSQGKVTVFGGGTSNPYFTTDTAAVLRALEIGADFLVKATQVDGIYTDDPKKNPAAEFLKQVTYDDVLRLNLRIMDASAVAIARENRLPVQVVALRTPGAMLAALTVGAVGSRVVPS
ncbi:MAG: UMP kinase [Deltaproteobacteria bacterium HGW-Deltaproteobacteria-17]|nr:MAG: UMP kinase [Deltaproteobacteria bacterium HGW-Deltaproteobacteria-17]